MIDERDVWCSAITDWTVGWPSVSLAIDTTRAEVCNAAMKRLAAFTVLLIVLAAPAWAGFDEGVAAYDRGD